MSTMTKYEKGPCSGGRGKIADWGGGSKRAGGDISHAVYILKEALNCSLHFQLFINC